jgi:hypothetical protein
VSEVLYFLLIKRDPMVNPNSERGRQAEPRPN